MDYGQPESRALAVCVPPISIIGQKINDGQENNYCLISCFNAVPVKAEYLSIASAMQILITFFWKSVTGLFNVTST